MLVQVVQSHFNSKFGWKLGVQQHPKGSQQAALATGAPPLRKMQPLVSEHSHVQVVRDAPSFVCLLDNKHCFSSCVQFGSQQPLVILKGAKVLRRTKINRGRKESTTNTDDLVEAVLNSVLGSSAACSHQDDFSRCEDCNGRVFAELCQDSQEMAEFACSVFCSPEDFVKACCVCVVLHP